MPAATHHIEKFHQSMAYIFYAIAAVDGSVRIEEKRKIKDLVDEYWTFESERVNSRDIIFSTLKKIIKSNYDVEMAFQNFKTFFQQHPELFTEEVKKEIMRTVNSIAITFHGRNKSESVFISRLYFLLQNGSKNSDS